MNEDLYALGTSAEDDMLIAFDQTLPASPKTTPISPNRIIYRSEAGTTRVIELSRKNGFHEIIFQAFVAYFQSNRFHELSDQTHFLYWRAVQRFVDWLNETGHETTDSNRYDCLKAHESYFMNDCGYKNSPLWVLLAVLKGGLVDTSLTDYDCRYLQTLLRLSKPSKNTTPEPFSLPDWFDMPWLRPILGEPQYLKLESPSRLFLSFRVVVAETLLYIMEIREDWQHYSLMQLPGSDTRKSNWFRSWNVEMLNRFGSFDLSGEAESAWSELMFLDLVRPNKRDAIKIKISQVGADRLRGQPDVAGESIVAWARKPCIFHPEYQRTYSPLEERLMSWLVACETVQPSDIGKLKTTDYAQEFSQHGRLLAMECSYYKGRSGRKQNTAILMASDCWTKAQYRYLSGLPRNAPLFRFNPRALLSLPDLNADASQQGDAAILWSIWKIPRVRKRLHAALRRAGASSVFLDAAMALTHSSKPYTVFKSQANISVNEYRRSVPRPIPLKLFSLTHIKNTAVFAGSDRYRDRDLINHHSHTSETEKHAYLTDANKDFVNRAGRITRLVLHDLQNVVYQPSVTAMELAINDFELRTRVIDATGSTDVQIHSIEGLSESNDTNDIILVPDTVEQALFFIHTIAQAEQRLSQLLVVRPDWVERTLLVRVEWMTRNLSRMRSAKKAQKEYDELKPHLPALFDHFLETVE